jgi:hypothetical protein
MSAHTPRQTRLAIERVLTDFARESNCAVGALQQQEVDNKIIAALRPLFRELERHAQSPKTQSTASDATE